MTNKERFISLLKQVDRNGVEELLAYIESSDFYIAPASTRFHGAYTGGLLEHSLNVYDELKRLLPAYPEVKVHEDSIIICSLLHDLCKANTYKCCKKWRRDENNKWENYDSWEHDERFHYGGHGSKSVYMAQYFIKLTQEEAVAINCHMSSWEDGAARSVGDAFEQFPFAWLLHVADESATFIKESKE